MAKGPSHPSEAIELRDPNGLIGNDQVAVDYSASNGHAGGSDSPPEHAVSAQPKWNQNQASVFKTLSTFLAFIILGMNDAAYGALLPYLEKYYHISYIVISLIFLSPLVGYVAAAATNNWIHVHFGQRGVALLGPACHLIAYVVIALHPPYPVLVVVFSIAGYGNGILDAGWNAYVGNLANSNQLLGFLHGFYGTGAVLAPLIATAMITKAHLQWYTYYYIMIGAAGAELATSLAAFWQEDGMKFQISQGSVESKNKGATRDAVKERVTLVASAFLLIYVGIEVSLGGWIVTYLIRVRDGDPFAAGMSATGFWLGLTVGRFTLGFATPRIGENFAIVLYLLIAIVFQLVFWLAPTFIGGSIAVALVGFFLGPLFPAVIVALTKILPRHLHVPAIGFAAAFGGGGGAILPFAVGAIAQKGGVQVLQPVIVALLALAVVLWAVGMPRIKAGRDDKMGKITEAGKRASRKISRRCAAWV